MPKYIPTIEDIYDTMPCVICGEDTGDKNKDVCSWQCENEKGYLEDVMETLNWNIFIHNKDEI